MVVFLQNRKAGTFLLLCILFSVSLLKAQVVNVDFTSPDTICVGGQVNITNLTTGGTTYYWNFCSGNTNLTPTGINIGNPGGLLNIPGYITLVKDGNICYSFITCQGSKSLIRYNHGTSFNNNPVSWTNLGGFGMLGDTVLGLRIRYDNGTWIGIINNNNRLVRLNFGNSVGNIPTATLLGPFPMLYTAHGLDILNENGTWIGYITCSWGNKLVRLNFGNSLLNTPVLTDLGTPGGLNMPGPFCLVLENGDWYSINVNIGNNTHTRLYFGNSLLNNPTGTNLGNICSPISLGGITLIRDCGTTTGFQLNYTPAPAPNLIWRLNFPSGITGPVTGTALGNIGNLNRPSQFSELFRVGDTLFLYVTNRQDFTITRLRFLPCTNASVPSSTLYDPPPYTYNQTGTYNINLIVNEGMANQANLCKSIVVMPAPSVNLGPDLSICSGTTTTLNAGPGFGSYLWSTGATTSSINVNSAGSYWVRVTKYGCTESDTVVVSLYPPVSVNIGPDATICSGTTHTFDAGACVGCTYIWADLTHGLPNIGTGSTYTTGTAATYMVTKSSAQGCIARDTAILNVFPTPVITTFPLTQTICSGSTTNITLTANQPGTSFTWTATLSSGNITGFSNGSGVVINQLLTNLLATPGTVSYTITPALGSCTGMPVIFTVTVNPSPAITNNPMQSSQCSGETFNLNLQSSIPGTTFSWTATGSSGFVNGYSGGSGPVISQTLAVTAFSTEEVTYRITPFAMGCAGPQEDYIVTVYPIPNAWFWCLTDSICSGAQTYIILGSDVGFATFSWTASASSPLVTGHSAGSGDFIIQSLSNTSPYVEYVTYDVVPVANGCTGPVYPFLQGVIPSPDVFFLQNSDTLCSGETTRIGLFSGIPGTIFSWTATSPDPMLSGFGPGTGDSIIQTLTSTGLSTSSVIYSIVPSSLGCAGTGVSDTIMVKPNPTTSANPPSQQLCSGQTSSILLSSNLPGTQFTWTCLPTSPSVTGFAPGSGTSISQTLFNSGNSAENVTYQVNPEASGCQGTILDIQVTVFPVPSLIINPPSQTICSGQTAVAAFSSPVAGCTFSWSCLPSSPSLTGYVPGGGPGISQVLFNSSFSPGNVTYTVTPSANGCPGPSFDHVATVNPLPVVTFRACFDTIITLNAQPVRLSGGVPAGGSYNGPGVNSATGTLYPALSGTGSKTITYTFTNTWGCPGSSIQTVHIANDPFGICGGVLTDIRDGHTYPTIQLGTQCWMAGNLNFGGNITSSANQRDNCIPEKFCYNDLGSVCVTAGGLYQWDELMQYSGIPGSKGICPSGWHVPTNAEWNTLFSVFYSNAFAGSPLLYSGYSGFNASLEGVEHENRQFSFAGFATLFWSSDNHGPFKAWAHGMNDYDHSVSYYPSLRSNAFSVRCLRD